MSLRDNQVVPFSQAELVENTTSIKMSAGVQTTTKPFVVDVPQTNEHSRTDEVDETTDLPFDRNESNECLSAMCGRLLYLLSFLIIICTLPFSLFLCIQIVQQYERAVIFRLGRAMPVGKAGMYLIVPCVEQLFKIDIRTLSFDVPPQEILTKDSVTVAVDAVIYYRIFKPMTSIIRVKNAYYSTMLLAQAALRTVLGTYDLQGVLSQRSEIQETMLWILDRPTDEWGVKVERVEIKDVRLPDVMQRAMAKEAEANREAQAKIIAADGEKRAARSLLNAAKVMSENKSALQLRYLQTLGSIAAENKSTIYFPLPLDSIGGDIAVKK